MKTKTLFVCPFGEGNLGKNIGCELAPKEILNELKSSIYLDEKGFKSNFEVHNILIPNSNIEETNKNIYDSIKNFDFKNRAVLIGGDHSITYSSFKAFNSKHITQKNLLIVFDAHADCVNNFNPPSHEDYLRTLIDEGILNSNDILLLGVRNIDGSEMEYLKMKKIKYYNMKKIFNLGMSEFTDAITEVANQYDNIYISIDIDVVDPAFAPGTGYIEPAGFTSREFLYVLERLFLIKKVKMIDIVEINPKKDINKMTVRLGAKIINEF